MTRPMFPHAVDATMMSAFRSCPQKMFRTYVEHWKPQAESVHLVAGGAFAKGIEVARKAYFEGDYQVPTIDTVIENGDSIRKVTWTHEKHAAFNKEAAEAVGLHALIVSYGDFECPPDSGKSLERTAGALEFYFEQYPLGADGADPIHFADGKRGIEFSFATPLDFIHPVTGDPILYTGRADMIADFAGGVYIFDEKTTSSLGASWSRQWEMRGQFTGYTWAAAEAGIRTSGNIVRGVSILKTKYDTQQAITYRTPWEVERWMKQTLLSLQKMKECWESGFWDYNMDSACAEYGGCSLISICKSESPESWLPMRFEQRVWDPLARRQLTVKEWEDSWGHQAEHPLHVDGVEKLEHAQIPSGAEGVILQTGSWTA